MSTRSPIYMLAVSSLFVGCQAFIDDADQQVYDLIEERQRDALAQVQDATIDKETVPKRVPSEAYDHVPSATQPTVPEAMRATTAPSTQPLQAPTSQEAGESIDDTIGREDVTQLSLQDVLRYAFRHARRFQTAKEDLYLAALALTLERHLWSPRFLGNIETQYANYGQIRDFDHAMQAVANVAVQQRLPYGGEVTARVINTLMRDLGRRITTGESGQIILEANVPLLRGAGRAASESRYQAERNLIYATRAFERFRRTFAVDVANAYIGLMLQRQLVANAKKSYRSFLAGYERTQALFEAGWVIELEAQRAQQELLSAWNSVVDAEETYQRQLDQFKILIGMPTTTPVDIVTKELPWEVPTISEVEVIRIATHSRLDLINDRDAIDDAKRGVSVARNNLLPDLNLRGNVTYDTNPGETNMYHFEHERATWRGFMDLELPLDRVSERNQYRRSQITLRRAQRRYDLSEDEIRAEVRSARRRIDLALTTLSIQRESMELAERRREAAEFRFQRGLVSNREVVDAENFLLRARNTYARAQSTLLQAILAFYRDAGMIRVDDEGKLLDFHEGNR